MVIAILYAIIEQISIAINNNSDFRWTDVNWGIVITATLAIILRFFNNEKLTL